MSQPRTMAYLSKTDDEPVLPSASSIYFTFPFRHRSNSIMEQITTSEKKLPPLLDLPLHLQQRIFAYLDEPYDLSLMIMRRTHPLLRLAIPFGYSSNRQIKKCQLWTAERAHSRLFPYGCYPCYCCLEVYPRVYFARRYSDEVELERRCRFCTRRWISRESVPRQLFPDRQREGRYYTRI